MARREQLNGTTSRLKYWKNGSFGFDTDIVFCRINRTFVISATSSELFKPQIEHIYKDYYLDPERKQDRKAHGER